MSLVINTTVTTASPRAQGQQPNSATTPVTPQLHNSTRGSSNGASATRTTPNTPVRGSWQQKSQLRARPPPKEPAAEPDGAKWGSNFWVTLIEPQTQTPFFACPATGQVSWDAPVGNYVLPPSEDGEWWELSDEARGGIPYYYQTKTEETVWERPSGFVIPFGIFQNTATGKRLSQVDRTSRISFYETPPQDAYQSPNTLQLPSSNRASPQAHRKSAADLRPPSSNRLNPVSTQLTPIPGSPYATEQSEPPSPSSSVAPSIRVDVDGSSTKGPKDSPSGKSDSSLRGKQKSTSYASHRPQQPQSLDAALEKLELEQHSGSQSDKDKEQQSSPRQNPALHYLSDSTNYELYPSDTSPPGSLRVKSRDIPSSPSRPVPTAPAATVGGRAISGPILNHAATLQLSPVKNRAAKPIAVDLTAHVPNPSITTLRTGTHPTFPDALVSDIQLFSQSDYARQYFSTHRSGFIFKRRIPVEQLMTWQKAPLTSPLLLLNRALHKNAVKIFKVLQHIMGDREKERTSGSRVPSDGTTSFAGSTVSLIGSNTSVLEEERWLLTEGLMHGELRDEIYCQLMKQLSGNPSTEGVFKGWQFLCVLLSTFPPSKDFETYLESFIQKRTSHQQGRIDVMAKYCLRRLSSISRRGPRGKPPLIAEIEIAADAAFNPSTFGESLDAIIRLQERNYPHQKVPIILPFLADGILALGGPRAEGIFRVPGDNESVSELKLRIDRGYYSLESVDDPHVLASLMKLWLRELCDPLIPSEMYNECIMSANDPASCIQIVHRLPTINRRVVLFVISFLQIFLDEKTQSVTKMTPANLALVMAPNLLRCNSDSMSIVFTNAQYEQIFVYHLLLHLKCDEIDAGYKPTHGLGAVAASKQPKNRSRRPT
ncbi:hypothetical protein D9611_000081 [Ephemerocybe angulata]|uniref:Rho GTPase-activating protein 39 n=1 Tax=Ephemerocybe angulata TaxID=980116 RepID=A0A8H5BNF2_9AGAR|nr:hypothetical protein D9611_000081 [Tulosesus angulatus]